MIADVLSKKKLNPIVTELFIRGRKLNIFLVFISQSSNKRELQQIAFNHWLLKLYESLQKIYSKPYSFLVTDATLASDNLSCFRKNLLERI